MPDERIDLAVIGLGPSGLAAALKAASRGMTVIAFTNRTEYVRQQRIKCHLDILDFLYKYYDAKDPDDVNFFDAIGADATVQIKDLERFLMRKLQAFPNVAIMNTIPEKPLQIQRDGNNNACLTLDGSTFHFRNLIAADGAKHSTSNQVNQYLKEKAITYKKSSQQERQLYQSAIQLKIRDRKIGEPTRQKESPSLVEQWTTLKKMGWDKDYFPKYYVFSNQNGKKFSFAGECPDKIVQMTNPKEREEALRIFASYMISLDQGVDPNDLVFHDSSKSPKKDVIRANVFPMEGHQAGQACTSLSTNQIFAPIGDARRLPNFYYGHGVNDGIRTGIAFVDAIQDDHSFNKEQYEALITQMDIELDEAMQLTENTMKAKGGIYLHHINEVIEIIKSSLQQKSKDRSVVQQLKALIKLKDAIHNFPKEIDSAYQAMKELDDLILKQISPTLSKRCVYALQTMLPKAISKAFRQPEETVDEETKQQLDELQENVLSYLRR